MDVYLIGWAIAAVAIAGAYLSDRRNARTLAVLLIVVGFGAAVTPLIPLIHTTRRRIQVDLPNPMAVELLKRQIVAEDAAKDPRRLLRYEATIFSQAGEDGILAEIFRRVGTEERFFVEFGSGDGRENNTVFLLMQGWSGVWIEGDEDLAEGARRKFAQEVADGRLKVVHAFITAENIEELFRSAGVPPSFDLLSIDIDRNDYWVWRAIRSYAPRVVVIEYNAIFPPGVLWVVDYEPTSWWDRTSHFGASLSALERLGREKGYVLVGCNLMGVNAFFVPKDLVGDKFAGPFTAEAFYQPPRYFLVGYKEGHPRRVARPADLDGSP